MTETIPTELTPDEIERLHELCMSVELQLQNIQQHHTKAFGPALLSVATFIVEKIYTCSADAESANLLIGSAMEAGLQNWIDQEERIRTAEASQTQTLDS